MIKRSIGIVAMLAVVALLALVVIRRGNFRSMVWPKGIGTSVEAGTPTVAPAVVQPATPPVSAPVTATAPTAVGAADSVLTDGMN